MYQANPVRHGVDIFEMQQDKASGFRVNLIGFHPSDKVSAISWSPAGDIFAVQEKEGIMTSTKHIWSFYMILQSEGLQETGGGALKSREGIKASKAAAIVSKTNLMAAADVHFEFRKIARHEMTESLTDATWDPMGRYMCIYGIKRPGPLDREKRSIRIYSVLGELLRLHEKLDQLTSFEFRPRPAGILAKKELAVLRKEWRKKYGK